MPGSTRRAAQDVAADDTPGLAWLIGGLVASLVSAAATLAVACGGSMAVGLAWQRPLQVIASLRYGAHVAVAEHFEPRWLSASLELTVAGALMAGMAYGTMIILLDHRPRWRTAAWIGLLLGLSTWMLIVKVAAPFTSPLTVRLVPLWATASLFAFFGLGLTLTRPLAALLAALFAVARSDDALPDGR